MYTKQWVEGKAKSYSEAWAKAFGQTPNRVNVVNALSVAIHETQAGDAWPGCHNWGATTLRALNVAERQALCGEALRLVMGAGLPTTNEHTVVMQNFQFYWKNLHGAVTRFSPNAREASRLVTPIVTKGHETRARYCQEVLEKAGLHEPRGEIHCDSAPAFGPYFVWFAKFSNDVDGAAYFVKLLAGTKERPKKALIVLDSGGSELELARTMYDQKYYTGFHDPKKVYPDGTTGAEKNVRAYADSLRRITPMVRAALTVGPVPQAPLTIHFGSRGADVERWQRILAHDVGGIEVDGIFGRGTELATKAWQASHALVPDGIVGARTWRVVGL